MSYANQLLLYIQTNRTKRYRLEFQQGRKRKKKKKEKRSTQIVRVMKLWI